MTDKTKTAKFAVHDDLVIYSVGDSPRDAILRAYEYGHENRTDWFVRPIDTEYARKICEFGFNPSDSFRVQDGVIVEWEE